MSIRFTPAVVPLESDDQTAINAAQDNVIGTKAPLNDPIFVGNVQGITKAMVGLSNVDNTSDANKPVSALQAAAIALKATKSDLPVNAVTDFGVVGDFNTSTLTGTDNYTNMQAFITFVTNNKRSGYIPAGNYGFAGTLTVANKAAWYIDGAGSNVTVLTQMTDNAPVITMGVGGETPSSAGFTKWRLSGFTLSYKNIQTASSTAATGLHFVGMAYECEIHDIYFQRGFYGVDVVAGQCPPWGVIWDHLHFGPNMYGGAINYAGGIAGVPNQDFRRMLIEANNMTSTLMDLRGYNSRLGSVEILRADQGAQLLNFQSASVFTIDNLKLENGVYKHASGVKTLINVQVGAYVKLGTFSISGGLLYINYDNLTSTATAGTTRVFGMGVGGGNSVLEVGAFTATLDSTGSSPTVVGGYLIGGADTGSFGDCRVSIGTVRMANGWQLSNATSGDTITRVLTVHAYNNGRFSTTQADADLTVTYGLPQTLIYNTALTAQRTVQLPDDSNNTAGTQWFEIMSRGAINGSNNIIVKSNTVTLATLTEDVSSVKIGWRQASPGRNGWFVLRQGPLVSAPATVIPPQVTAFTASGTYTLPTGAKTVDVAVIGGGGAGGSGRRGAVNTIRCGGGAGGGGGVTYRSFDATDLTATVTVTIGAAGVGGTSVSTDSTSGNAGTAGGTSNFGAFAGATGGGLGGGGTATVGNAGAGGVGLVAGSAGGTASTTGLVGGNPTSAGGAGAGGAGGGITSGNVAAGGGVGITSRSVSAVSQLGGVVDSTLPVAGVASSVKGVPGAGSGGGAASITTNAQAGLAGVGYGAGGAGGGASLDAGGTGAGGSSGAGGNGAPGYVLVITTF